MSREGLDVSPLLPRAGAPRAAVLQDRPWWTRGCTMGTRQGRGVEGHLGGCAAAGTGRGGLPCPRLLRRLTVLCAESLSRVRSAGKESICNVGDLS